MKIFSFITALIICISGIAAAQTPHLNNTCMLLVDPVSGKQVTLCTGTLSSNRIYTFPDVGGTVLTTTNVISGLPSPTGHSGQFLSTDNIGTLSWGTPAGGGGTGASAQTTTAGSTAAVGNTASMLGLAASIKPSKSGNILIIISGTLNQASNGSPTSTAQIYYGTGTAPIYAAATTGNPAGASTTYNAQGTDAGFTQNAVVTGLTVGQTYWIDLNLVSSNNGHKVTPTNLVVSAIEF